MTGELECDSWEELNLQPPLLKRPHPPPHCANIHCLVSVNFQQASMNIIGCNYFGMQEFSYTPLFNMHFQVRRHFVRLPLCCHLWHGNKIYRNISGKVETLLPYHQHLPLTSRANIIKYLLTYSMVQSPSWEANWFAASQEIPRILWNPKVHYRIHKLPPPVPILG